MPRVLAGWAGRQEATSRTPARHPPPGRSPWRRAARVPAAAPGPGLNPGRGDGSESGAHGPAARRRPARLAGAGGRSVWQQSLSAWRGAGLEWQRLAGWEPADADQQRTEPIPVVPAMVPLDAGLAAPPSGGPARQAGPPRGRGQHPRPLGPAARIPGAAAARSWSVPLPAWRCSPWRSLASSSPAGWPPAAARPGWWWPTRPPGSPMRSSPGRAEHPRRKCCPRSPGWPRPAARWWRWARRPRFPSPARWSSRRPMAAARGSRPSCALRPAGGCR